MNLLRFDAGVRRLHDRIGAESRRVGCSSVAMSVTPRYSWDRGRASPAFTGFPRQGVLNQASDVFMLFGMKVFASLSH